MDPVIEVEGLGKDYGAVRALGEVDLALPPGRIGLLGPNGAGKSTFIKLLLGLLRPTRGTGRVLGHGIDERREVRRRVGYMPEVECHIPGMDAVTYVSYCGELHGMPPAEAMKRAHVMLDLLGLDEARYRSVDGYSSGMKQRLKLAQALVSDPDLLFLDEPSHALDPEGREELLELVRAIHDRAGVTIVLSTHILADVEAVCDRVVILHGGEVVAHDAIDALVGAEPGHSRLTVRGDVRAVRERLEAEGAAVETTVDGVLGIVWPDGADRTETVLEAVRDAGAELRGLTGARRTLEDVFLDRVGEVEGTDEP